METIDNNEIPKRRLEDLQQAATINWEAPGAPAVPLVAAPGSRTPLRAVASLAVSADGISVLATEAAKDLEQGHYMLWVPGCEPQRAVAPSAEAVEAVIPAPRVEKLTPVQIDEVWNAMPGGADGWLKQFGYQQFADAIQQRVLARASAFMFGTARPTDDEMWDATIRDRDTYHDWADKLAEAISKYFDAYIGEHSNTNCPWAEALEAIETAAIARQAQPTDRDAERYKNLFFNACADLGLINEELGLDPDDGGAGPIIAAIRALKSGSTQEGAA